MHTADIWTCDVYNPTGINLSGQLVLDGRCLAFKGIQTTLFIIVLRTLSITVDSIDGHSGKTKSLVFLSVHESLSPSLRKIFSTMKLQDNCNCQTNIYLWESGTKEQKTYISENLVKLQ